MQLYKKVIRAFFSPSECVFCKDFSLEYICSTCKEKVLFVYEPFCVCCQRPSIDGLTHITCHKKYTPDQLIVPFYYSNLVRTSIHLSKYGKNAFSIIDNLVDYSLEFKEQFNYNYFKDYTFVPIPSDLERYKSRGFNLPTLISQNLSNKLKMPYKEILSKTRTTTPLHNLSRVSRSTEVRNLFSLKEVTKLKKIVLVDDIITTGSTFLSAANLLKRNGVESVICFALSYQKKNFFSL